MYSRQILMHIDDQVRVLFTTAPWDQISHTVSDHVRRTCNDNIWDPVWDVLTRRLLMHVENEVKDAHHAHG